MATLIEDEGWLIVGPDCFLIMASQGAKNGGQQGTTEIRSVLSNYEVGLYSDHS